MGWRKLILILLFLPLLSFGQMNDKTKHKIAGHVISMGVGITVYKITDKPVLSFFSGVVASLLAGHIKEEYDLYQGRVYDKLDLAATVWGGTVGGVCIIPIIDINRKNRREKKLKFE